MTIYYVIIYHMTRRHIAYSASLELNHIVPSSFGIYCICIMHAVGVQSREENTSAHLFLEHSTQLWFQHIRLAVQ